jgi:hypothetical protein
MMKTINFIAKTITSILWVLAGTTALFGQFQKTSIQGMVKNETGQPIQHAEITFSFNQTIMATVLSDERGLYTVSFENFGGIESVYASVKSEKYKPISPFKLSISELDIKRDFTLGKLTNTICHSYLKPYWIINTAHIDKALYSTNHVLWSNEMNNEPFRQWIREDEVQISKTNMSREPHGTFAYNKPGLYDPVYYYENISSQFTIVDKTGKPIPSAWVEIKIPDDKARWGITDENGQLMMHMQFERGARNGKITITAEGFRSKKILGHIFYPDNRNTIKLHAVK